MDTSGWNMYVFRDGRQIVPGNHLISAVKNAIGEGRNGQDQLMTALLAAGELECALADADSPHADAASEITDRIAEAFVRADAENAAELDVNCIVERLSGISAPDQVRISVHEGFAFYALHPIKFALVVDQLVGTGTIAVVGIRSIGLTLSAVTLAELRRRGREAERISVRPTGHPYDRQLEFTDEQRAWVGRNANSQFVVADEGPGLSGSSFIATGEALRRAGVPAEQITFAGTRLPDVYGLRTPDGVTRWRKFRAVATEETPVLPRAAEVPLSGGEWRRELKIRSEYPGSWTQLERLKYLSRDRQRFFRFEGYGHYGDEHGERARLLADGGFGPMYFGNMCGFGCYEYVRGRTLRTEDVNGELLGRIAEYCAFRAREFPEVKDKPSDLEQMLRFNWKNEFGAELEPRWALAAKKCLVTDSRMMPRKWIKTVSGQVLKVDSTSHGDDHFFPGPCDIAWDLAGASVEWKLGRDAESFLIRRYSELTGDDVRERIDSYLLAYATFRMAYSRMAARAMGGTPEEPLLTLEYQGYRQQALEIHQRVMAARPQVVRSLSHERGLERGPSPMVA